MAKCKNCKGKFIVRYFNQKCCSKSCNAEYLKENQPSQVKKVSDKRQAELDIYYSTVRPEYLKENPFCVRCAETSNPKIKATEIHHKNGREGERLNDTRFFQSSCNPCHKWIHNNPKPARENNWLI